ncbi:MAG: hypothetical protein REH83_07060, partial [Rickettsiella sp.]|nr:hypothetical protein [Rickettsiella sp.]
VLNAALRDIKFTTSSKNSDDFEIFLKNNSNSNKAIIKKETLSKFFLTVTDPNKGLPVKLSKLQKKEPNLTVDKAINKILEKNNKVIIAKNVVEILKNLKVETLELAENMNNETKINNFFDKLKVRLLSESIAKKFISVENLIHFNNNEFHSFQLSFQIESISDNQKISSLGIELKKKLICLKDQYFSQSLSFKEFQTESIKEIKAFKANNPLTTKQLSLLDKILNFIAEWIPNPIYSEKDRINHFFKDTVQAKVVIVEDYIRSTKPTATCGN